MIRAGKVGNVCMGCLVKGGLWTPESGGMSSNNYCDQEELCEEESQ